MGASMQEKVSHRGVITAAVDVLSDLLEPINTFDLRHPEDARWDVERLAAAGFADRQMALLTKSVLQMAQHSIDGDIAGLENPVVAGLGFVVAKRILSGVGK